MACGVGDYTQSLARALSECARTEVAVLTSTEAAAARSGAGCEIFPVMETWRRDESARVAEVVRSWAPEVTHVQYPTLGYRGELASRLPVLLRRLGVPVVQTWHEYFPLYFPVPLGLAWRLLGLGLPAGDVVVVRPDYAQHMRWWYRILTARKRFHLIPVAPSIPRVALTEAERASIRGRYAPEGKALLAFFGFLFEHKGIEEIFEIMDPHRHHLVLVGEIKEWDPYQTALGRRAREQPLASSVTMAGFLPPLEAAQVLAAADAVVLPFRHGGGEWNTTIKAAALQGTFVLTTSMDAHGFDAAHNVYYARPRDTEDMRQALGRYLGRREPNPEAGPSWPEIARRHLELYQRQR
jgi:glycosyltransferase involved in cell wall biosynthesis